MLENRAILNFISNLPKLKKTILKLLLNYELESQTDN